MCGKAALDHDIIPVRESGRFGLHAETGRVGSWAGFNPACRKSIPTHCLSCCCGALSALASPIISVCLLPICLRGETWLPSSMLQACEMLVHSIRKLIHLFLEVAYHQLHPSIYILHCGLARHMFFFLGDGVIALGNCLARLP